MTFNLISNDPLAQTSLSLWQQPTCPDRPSGRGGFNFESYDHQTPHNFWQSREAALATNETWEVVAGDLTNWADRSTNLRHIDLAPVYDDGRTFGPNVYRDGQGVQFFNFNKGPETIYPGDSAGPVSCVKPDTLCSTHYVLTLAMLSPSWPRSMNRSATASQRSQLGRARNSARECIGRLTADLA